MVALAEKPSARSVIVLPMSMPPDRPAVMAARISATRTLTLTRQSTQSTNTDKMMGLKSKSIREPRLDFWKRGTVAKKSLPELHCFELFQRILPHLIVPRKEIWRALQPFA